ncbi:hypothetical protein HB943_10270 [Listeria weihenstephanensis]|uniref:Uncharacterized protein n=1 Tax=Listeria weihenstephanensis TaxID=1006155 RepID=A0A841Z9K2_9LIST|nr:hypothetical protein [Listeria weihenstephanensis]MBC1500993.1 hypothetical protein [Listeria weihenstephanensis]
MDEMLLQAGVRLVETASRNTIGIVSDKIKAIKLNGDIKEQQVAYEEIINALLRDKQDLERVAQEYKSEYEKITISDKDIEHLHSTVTTVLNLFSGADEKLKANEATIKGLVNKDTLKTMQLLGFNYREAIGEPLTAICADKLQKNIFLYSTESI